MNANTARWSAARAQAAWLLLPLVATTACATATYTRYHEQTEDWQRAESAAPAADAGDHLFEGAPVLDRAELVRSVLARNPTVRAAREAWRAAIARDPQGTAFCDP